MTCDISQPRAPFNPRQSIAPNPNPKPNNRQSVVPKPTPSNRLSVAAYTKPAGGAKRNVGGVAQGVAPPSGVKRTRSSGEGECLGSTLRFFMT